MSYILDALRRADSEREQGSIPGLNTHTTSAEDSLMRVRPWWSQPWVWVTAGVCGGVLAAVVVSALITADPPAPIVAAVPPPPAPAPAPAPVAPQQQAALVAPAPSVSAAPPPPIYNAPPLDARKPPAGNNGNSGGNSGGNSSSNSSAGPGGGGASGGGTEPKVLTLNELPDEVRRQLPALAIGGSSYSETPANRLLILNGQVFREGDRINADLVLEQIQLKSAILRFNGYRYSVNY